MVEQERWSLSLVLPAYNEAAVIPHAIQEADDALSRLAADYEILVVDDGSLDGTAAVVREAMQERPHVRLLIHPRNRGYSAALRTGFEAARFDRVAFTDADCQFDLADLDRLVPLTARVPLAVGYRVDRQDPWPRRFLSRGYNLVSRTLLGTRVRDCDCALKVFRRDALQTLLPETPGFFVNTEMLTRARLQGYAVEEVGVRHRPRVHGTSKVSRADIPRTLRTLLPFWWTRVLFPRSSEAEQAVPSETRARLGVVALFLAAALLFFLRLGTPLQEPDEARYAEVPRQMLATGNWVVPVLHGHPYYDKPPLLYWTVMGTYQIFGVHDWAARLGSSLPAFLVVFVTWWWARRALGARAALAGAFILCLSARFVYLGRLLTPDSMLCLWVLTALATAHQALAGPRLRYGWWLLSAAACALGLLTKGPVTLVLVVVPLLVFQFLDPRTARPGVKSWIAYLTLALGLAAPWYTAVALHDPEFLRHFFWTHNAVRYVAPFDHAKPIWFFLPGTLLGMLPWALLLPGFLRMLLGKDEETAGRRPAVVGLFLLAALWTFAFYSLGGSKRAVYVLPVLPLTALALGWYLDELLRRPLQSFALAATLMVLLAGIGGSLAAVSAELIRPTTAAGFAAGCATAAVALWALRRRSAFVASWQACGVATFLLLIGAVYTVLPNYARKFALRGQIRAQEALWADPTAPIVCYPRRWDSVSFYLQREDVRVYDREQAGRLLADLEARPGTLVFVRSDEALSDVLKHLSPSMEFIPCGRPGGVIAGLVRRRGQEPWPVLVLRTGG